MNVWEYIKDKILTVILHFFCMILLSAFLFITGNTMTTVILILAAWIFILLAVLGLDGYRTIRYFNHMFAVLKELKDPYLVAEVLPLSDREQDRVYREVLRRCMKSVIEKIALIEGERKDYQEFIETWVHEVKAPMSVIRLILANEVCFDNFSNQILSRLSMIDNAIDIALYYARSDEVYRDYIIAPVILEEVIAHTLHQHMQLYIEEHINVEFDFPQEPLKLSVPTDRKWLDFILRQILRNAIKYKKEDVVFIRFMAKPLPQGVQLCVEDQGIGIPEHDLDRIFEKGYTGTNGRDTTTGDRVKSTGIGLYLCRKLCNKLGITITARSKVGEYTRIYLQFPNSDYHQRVT